MNNTIGQIYTSTKVGLVLPPDIPYMEWEDIGINLARAKETVKFMLGDWLNYGENAYGEKYAQAIDNVTYDYAYLRNIAYVCRNVEMSRRRDSLSFSHHTEVAHLDPDLQDLWLQTAEDQGLNSKVLRQAIKDAKGIDEKKEYSVEINIEHIQIYKVWAKSSSEACIYALREAKKAITDTNSGINILEDK